MRRRCYALFVALFSVHPLGREHWMSKEGASHRTPTPAHLHGPSCPFFKPLLIPPPWRPPTSHFFLSPLFLYQAFFFLCLLPVHYPTLWISTAAVTVPVRFLAATRLPKIRINSRIRPCAPQLPLCSAEDQDTATSTRLYGRYGTSQPTARANQTRQAASWALSYKCP